MKQLLQNVKNSKKQTAFFFPPTPYAIATSLKFIM